MENIFKFLVYRRTENISGGNGELKAGFRTKLDANQYCNLLNNMAESGGYSSRFYVVEVQEQ